MGPLLQLAQRLGPLRRRCHIAALEARVSISPVVVGLALVGAAFGMVVDHLGVGLADVVFADAIVRRATEMGLGTELPR